MGKKAKLQLRDNLRRAFDEGVARFTELVRTDAVKRSTLARIVSEEGQTVDLDQLDWIAEAFGVEPWQLLHPDFDTAMLTAWALQIARKMEGVPEPLRARVYARFVQDADFATQAVEAVRTEPPPEDVPANAPGTLKPRRLRRVLR
jgi:transcriptional regulator with XRE-family HTH domain